MTEVVSAPDSSSTSANLGLFSRLMGVLWSPRSTYAGIVAKPRWVGALFLVLAVTSAAQYVVLSSPDMQDAIIDQQVRAVESRGNVMSDEQYSILERFIGYLPVLVVVGTLVVGPLVAAAVAGIVMWIFTTLMGGKGTFRQVFAVMTHASFITALSALFSAGLMAIGAKPTGFRAPGANLAVFVPMLEETSFVTVMLRSIDFFLLWWMVTLSIGLGVLYRRRTGPIATTFIGIYAVIALLIATLTSGS